MSHQADESSTSPSTAETDPTKMILGYFGNEFPHDDLKDTFRRLFGQSKDRRYPALARFIHEATLAVRKEIRSLPDTQRALFPPFGTVFHLADFPELRSGPLGGAVDGLLLCAVQIATFIG